ncbi:hypothetical protein ACIA8K_00485 [Catenuloplanes sp. NPDC051500]|uniref:hypothetical protein n=1 Tax=Catenuloplanes sp. NPDC051500 TaxID=3363959 RepID=UPI0037AB30C9
MITLPLPAHWVVLGTTVLIIAVEAVVYFLLYRRPPWVRWLIVVLLCLLCVAAIAGMVWLLGLNQTDAIVGAIGALIPIFGFIAAALLPKTPVRPPDR